MTSSSAGSFIRPLRRGCGLPAALLVAIGCAEPEPIHLGLAGPFADPVGAPMQRAARLAVEHINAAGGINGRPLVLIEMDDHGDPDSAIAVATALLASPAVAVIGHLWSTTTIAAAPIYGSTAVALPMVTPSSSSPEVSWLGEHVFRVCPSDDAHGTALADWARQALSAQRAGILYLNDDYGRGVRQAFASRFVVRGGTVVGSFPYLDAGRDAAAYLDRLALEDSLDAILLAGYPEDAAEVLGQTRSRGITVPVLGGDALEGVESTGSLAEGVLVSAAWFPDGRSAAAREFLDSYAAAFPDTPVPNQPAAATWDAVHLLAAVLRTTNATRGTMGAALATVGTGRRVHEGVTGPIGFDERGDLAQSRITITVVRDGQLVRAEQP
ncbi:MAG: ABC transporter substrate-binding protein [Gemmatimonadales bacterium]